MQEMLSILKEEELSVGEPEDAHALYDGRILGNNDTDVEKTD